MGKSSEPLGKEKSQPNLQINNQTFIEDVQPPFQPTFNTPLLRFLLDLLLNRRLSRSFVRMGYLRSLVQGAV